MLHITNGESVRLQDTGLPGQVIYWKDVLHEGPVPAGLTSDQLSEARARFLASCGWGSCEEIAAEFAERNRQLSEYRKHDELILWFEHDLYDQLQLMQILEWLSSRDRGGTRLSLISIGEFPGIDKFTGLGQLQPDQLRSLFPARQEISREALDLGRRAWQAFCSPDPTEMERLLAADTTALPFLRDATMRHLEQFPSLRNGLSRTERQILEVISSGARRRVQIFLGEQKKEERIFMGDAVFWRYLDALRQSRRPLLDSLGEEWLLTETGVAVLEGRADHVRLNGIDRWLGGVHLRGEQAEWRWDETLRKLVLVNVADGPFVI